MTGISKHTKNTVVVQPSLVSIELELEGGGPANDDSGGNKVHRASIQLSAHSIGSASFIREAKYVFPSVDFNCGEGLIVIPTMQHAQYDLVRIGDEIEAEKDVLLLAFFAVAKQFCQLIEAAGHWADYIDPCSGLPVKTDGQKPFSEVECAQVLLGYSVMNAGCCKIIMHPDWGSAVYPASIFTTAPQALVTQSLSKIAGGTTSTITATGTGTATGNVSSQSSDTAS